MPSLSAAVALVAIYIISFRYLFGHDEYRAWLERVLLSESRGWNYLGFFLLLNLALLAPGSAALVILASLPIFGPSTTFLLSLAGGFTATVIAHQFGWHARGLARSPRRRAQIEQVEGLLSRYRRHLWLLAFVSRAVPNPLYDIWALAFGFLRVPLRNYLPFAILGGGLLLAALCYLPGLLGA